MVLPLFFIEVNQNPSTERKVSVIMEVRILFLLKAVDGMAKIIKVYQQSIPETKFIGKNYGNSKDTDWAANWGDAFASDIFGKVKRASNKENKSNLLYQDIDAYVGLCYRNEKTGAYDAWVGMFAPIETEVDMELDYIDFSQQNLGVCWIYGKENEVHSLVPQCAKKLIAAGMKIKSDKYGYIGHFERDQCPRFTTPDEKGNIILDYCYFVE